MELASIFRPLVGGRARLSCKALVQSRAEWLDEGAHFRSCGNRKKVQQAELLTDFFSPFASKNRIFTIFLLHRLPKTFLSMFTREPKNCLCSARTKVNSGTGIIGPERFHFPAALKHETLFARNLHNKLLHN